MGQRHLANYKELQQIRCYSFPRPTYPYLQIRSSKTGVRNSISPSVQWHLFFLLTLKLKENILKTNYYLIAKEHVAQNSTDNMGDGKAGCAIPDRKESSWHIYIIVCI
jgi:hypothetical protein